MYSRAAVLLYTKDLFWRFPVEGGWTAVVQQVALSTLRRDRCCAVCTVVLPQDEYKDEPGTVIAADFYGASRLLPLSGEQCCFRRSGSSLCLPHLSALGAVNREWPHRSHTLATHRHTPTHKSSPTSPTPPSRR
jgi:hypothetical protein